MSYLYVVLGVIFGTSAAEQYLLKYNIVDKLVDLTKEYVIEPVRGFFGRLFDGKKA